MIRPLACGVVSAYDLAAGKTLPEFLKDAKGNKKSLRRNFEFKNRLELIQDFEFPTCSSVVRVSPDRRFIGAVGVYPPALKIFDTEQLSIKFSRGLDAEVVDFEFLSHDYSKLALLQVDRTVEFHAQGGRHHRMRVPKCGRQLCYVRDIAELLIVGSTEEVYRVDLEEGRFMQPYKSQSGADAFNCAVDHPTLPVVLLGGANGTVEVFDYRLAKAASSLDVACALSEQQSYPSNGAVEVTALAAFHDGMLVGVGTSVGICEVYDVRSSRPLCHRDHMSDLPVHSISFQQAAETARTGELGGLWEATEKEAYSTDSSLLASAQSQGPTLVSADRRSIKIWSMTRREDFDDSFQNVDEGAAKGLGRDPGGWSHSGTKLLASLEPQATGTAKTPPVINHVCVYPNSGLIFAAVDSLRIGTFFVPALGVAPRWCSFLDSLTEELEKVQSSTTAEDAANVYGDFRFVTRSELAELSIEKLIGTPLLRAYMHGFFMDARLYQKLKALAKPHDVGDAEIARKKMLESRMELKKKMRIQVKNKLPIVNQRYAQKLKADAELEDDEHAQTRKKKSAKLAKEILEDTRFSSVFTNPNFVMEEVALNEEE